MPPFCKQHMVAQRKSELWQRSYPQCLHVLGNMPRPFQSTSLSPKTKALFFSFFLHRKKQSFKGLNVFHVKEQATETWLSPKSSHTLPLGQVLKLSRCPSQVCLLRFCSFLQITLSFRVIPPSQGWQTPLFCPPSNIFLTRLLYKLISYSRLVGPKGTISLYLSRKDPRGQRGHKLSAGLGSNPIASSPGPCDLGRVSCLT